MALTFAWQAVGAMLAGSAAAAAVVVAQAAYTVATVPKLPPASGPARGVVAAPASASEKLRGRVLRLLVIGDSVVEGTGVVGTHDDAFSGHVARALATESGAEVRWACAGKAGATSVTMRRDVMPAAAVARDGLDGEIDVVALSVGVNDALGGSTSAAFARDLATLLSDIRGLCPTATIVLSAEPPVRQFPSLPTPLSAVLGWRTSRVFKAGQATMRATPGAVYAQPIAEGVGALDSDPWGLFLADGFHPGPKILVELGRSVARAWASHSAGKMSGFSGPG